MTELPEPACTVSPYEVNHIFWEAGHEQAGCGSPLFTKAQMLQFRRDVLEAAALVCDGAKYKSDYEPITQSQCAAAIRKLKDSIK